MKNAGIMAFCLAAAALPGVFNIPAGAQDTKPENPAETTAPATQPATIPATKPAEPPLRQESLIAARAAAIEKLLDKVGKLKVADGKSTLKNLMDDQQGIKIVVIAYFSSLETKGEPEYSGARDKKCAVTLEASVENLQQALNENFAVYKGKKFKKEDVTTIAKLNDDQTLSETASGEAEPKKWLPDGEAVAVGMEGFSHESLLTGEAEKYWSAHCTDEGRLDAVKKARKRAVDSLLRQVEELKVNGRVTVRDIVGDSWGDAELVEELTSGARETTVLYYRSAPIVEVTVEMRLRGFYASLRSWAKTHGKDKAVMEILTRLALNAEDEKCTAAGLAAVDKEGLKDADKDKEIAGVLTAAEAFKDIGGYVSKTLIGENSRPLRVNAIAFVALKISEAKIMQNMTVGEYAAVDSAFGRTFIEFLQLIKTTESVNEGDKPVITAGIEMTPLQRALIYYASEDKLKIK